MNIRRLLLVTSFAVLFLVWGSAGAQTAGQAGGTPQQYPTTSAQNPAAPAGPTATETPDSTYPSSTATQKISQKEKHWSGTLVDVSCMAKELSTASNAPAQQPATTAPAGVPHFAASEPSPGGGQQRPGGGMGPGEGNPNTTPTPATATPSAPDMSPAESAQMAKAARIDNAAKQCPPSSSTQIFGLSMSGGQVVQFDREGDARAAEALKEVSVQPGKKVKAKVTGVMANTTTVKVASVEVKGKRSPQGSSASSSGSGR
jgi:hypothetical protein